MLATGCCLQSDGLISEASTPTWTRPKTKRRTPESAPGRTCRGLNLAPDTDPAKPTAESQGSRRSQVGWGGAAPRLAPTGVGVGGLVLHQLRMGSRREDLSVDSKVAFTGLEPASVAGAGTSQVGRGRAGWREEGSWAALRASLATAASQVSACV